MSLQRAWELTRELLRDHTSHSFAALAGWAYAPTGAEIALWDRYELEGRLRRPGWRPWLERRNDPLRPAEPETARRERLARRRRLNAFYHITE